MPDNVRQKPKRVHLEQPITSLRLFRLLHLIILTQINHLPRGHTALKLPLIDLKFLAELATLQYHGISIQHSALGETSNMHNDVIAS